MDNCPVCQSGLYEEPPKSTGDHTKINCPNCGRFRLSRTLGRTIDANPPSASERAALSRAIWKAQLSDKCPLINSDMAEKIMADSELPTPAEQAENLILWVANNSEPGHHIRFALDNARAALGSTDKHQVKFIIDSMSEKKLLTDKMTSSEHAVRLSFEGWEKYHQLKRKTSSGPRAIMAMDFKNKVLSEVLEEHFKPASLAAGFRLERLDDNPKAGLIDEQMRVEIRRASFLIADLSDQNAGAYWEAGFAEGVGKPVIYTCEKEIFQSEDRKPHFDTSHHHTITWEKENPAVAANELKATIRATLPELARMED